MTFQQGFEQQQKQLQKLAMTQQMRQSIQILKYNADDLQKFLMQKALENPFIVVKRRTTSSFESGSFGKENDLTAYLTSRQQPSLFQYLIEQVHLTMRKTPLRYWVLFLINHLDSNGYLKIELAEIIRKYKVDRIMLLDALTLLQQLDPPGVGARSLQECLMLQADEDRYAPQFTYQILRDDFENFTEKKWQKIAQKYQISLNEIQKIFDYVRHLTPFPGAAYSQVEIGYIQPDAIVYVDENTQKISFELTRQTQPQVHFKQEYYNSFNGVFDEQVMKYLLEKKKDYQALAKDLEQRSNTLTRVITEIIARQKAFFLSSQHPLGPLLLKDIALKLNLHESTISRAVNGKYLQTNFGTFELKSFFSQAVSYQNQTNSQVTAQGIQQKIQNYIANEDKAKPLSDQKIVELLQQEGLNVSRRTVAKYRDLLGIASSSKRKRFD